ncbi:flagellar hook-length control protein FliK [uncultured Brachyspira sp.]|uniref:flagellar hook-length control protein FliK n=1 Tax=uncultured Brachyspira sp. TaxID=221953 RepID=UPI0026283DFA|nr:flagellar hook-length control protein FliK [uncultured Brachyspira sp.]
MINGLGNSLSFADSNVSSNNNAYSSNNYGYDDSFANMLNKMQTDYSYSSSVSNKIEKHIQYEYEEKNYEESNAAVENYNSYDDYNIYSTEEANKQEYSKESQDNKINNEIDNNSNKTDDKKAAKIEEEKTENQTDEINISYNESNDTEENITDDNISAKEKLALTKEKAKLILQNTFNNKKTEIKEDKEINNKEINAEENIFAKTDKKINTKNSEEIENIKKQIESLNAEELSEDDKKELEDLIESLENLKAMIENDDKMLLTEDTENNKESIEINNINSSDNKEIKIVSNKDNDKNIETKNINDINKDINDINIEDINNNIDMHIENKYADKKDTLEIKNNNSTVNNTISDDKGVELTIINMKDSPDSANLKGYNHYNNNVSKTHNSTNITDNMIKFQDLMGRLVEKAQVAVNNGKSEVLMSLNPEYLGKIRLKISMDGDNLIGKIFVDNADIKDIFTKNLDTVITSLSEIGINIEGFDVMLRQDMPNDGGFEEELANIQNRFASENADSIEEIKTDIKAYIVPERKLNLLI